MKKEGLSNATRGQAVAADFKQDLPAARWGQMATVVFMFLLAKIMWTIFKPLKDQNNTLRSK